MPRSTRLLGAPRSAWDGGPRGDARDAHTSIGGRDMRERRHLLLPALRALQARVGWISETGLDYVCTRLGVPPADAWGVATFYALLSTTPRAPTVIHLCDDIACRCQGAEEIAEELERSLGPAHAHGPSGDHVHVDPNGRDVDALAVSRPVRSCAGGVHAGVRSRRRANA